MSISNQAGTVARPARSILAVVLTVAIAAVMAAVVGYQAVAAPSPSAASLLPANPGGPRAQAAGGTGLQGGPPSAPQLRPGGSSGAGPGDVTVADGVVPDGVTVFDDEFPAVAGLDPGLRAALRRAAREATGDGVGFVVTSGWRSRAYQEELLREAISRYGSEAEAARWVATPDTSLHVSGDAVDLGDAAATMWLSEHGAAYGLCQTYRNEPWHYELRPAAVDHGCPTPYADPTHDPRMHR